MKSAPKLMLWVGLCTLWAWHAAAVADEAPTPAWESPEVVKAAIEIGLDEAQLPEFRRIVAEYLTDLGSMVQQELRRESTNKDRTIKRKNRGLIQKMDEQARVLLREDQWPKYLVYKEALLARMDEAAAAFR